MAPEDNSPSPKEFTCDGDLSDYQQQLTDRNTLYVEEECQSSTGWFTTVRNSRSNVGESSACAAAAEQITNASGFMHLDSESSNLLK